jgi:UTP--glucose-1-phosphate uridylyltransferase
MQVRKAVITAAGAGQRNLPMQMLMDQQGKERSVLSLIVGEALHAGIDDICVVVWPGDEAAYAKLVADQPARVTFIPQIEPRGYAHSVWCARDFVGSEGFLHLVGDHIYVERGETGSARRLVETAIAEDCAVSGVQITHESELPNYGAVGGRQETGKPGIFRIETVLEKPTPTQAEQQLIVPGLRTAHYLCFFGMHVLTPHILQIIGDMLAREPKRNVSLSAALAELARREQYLALIESGGRFDVGVKYGLFLAQLALGIAGADRDELLTQVIRVLASND